jgi:hypothetical protein
MTMIASSPYGGLSLFSVLESVALASSLVSLWHHRKVLLKEKDDLQKELDGLRQRTEKRNRKAEEASNNIDGKGTKKTPSVDDDGLLIKQVEAPIKQRNQGKGNSRRSVPKGCVMQWRGKRCPWTKMCVHRS